MLIRQISCFSCVIILACKAHLPVPLFPIRKKRTQEQLAAGAAPPQRKPQKLPHTGGVISNGACAPQAARTAATVSRNQLDLRWRSARSASARYPALRSALQEHTVALTHAIPTAVAALDNPSKFAVTLALTASIACLSCDALPNKGRRTGAIRRDSRSASPEACSSSITPLQKHISPAMPIASVTAPPRPLLGSAAGYALPACPVTAPQSKREGEKCGPPGSLTDSTSPFPPSVANIPSERDRV